MPFLSLVTVTLTYDLGIQTCPSKWPNTSSLWICPKSVQRFPEIFHTQTKKSQTAPKTEPYAMCGRKLNLTNRQLLDLFTILHRTDLIIFPLTLQTIITAPMMSIWGKGGVEWDSKWYNVSQLSSVVSLLIKNGWGLSDLPRLGSVLWIPLCALTPQVGCPVNTNCRKFSLWEKVQEENPRNNWPTQVQLKNKDQLSLTYSHDVLHHREYAANK